MPENRGEKYMVDPDYRQFEVKGKCIDTGEWVEGFLYIVTKGEYHRPIQNGWYISTIKQLKNGEILLTGAFEVDPQTVHFIKHQIRFRE